MPEAAKRIIDKADEALDEHQKFKIFLNDCCAVIEEETRTCLEKTASFDLTILSEEGFLQLSEAISTMAEVVAENLHALVADLLSGPAGGKQYTVQ